MIEKSIVAEWIVLKRKELGLNRKELALQLLIPYSRLGRYEKKGIVLYNDLLNLLNIFETDFKSFFEEILLDELPIGKNQKQEIITLLSDASNEEKLIAINCWIYLNKSETGRELLNEMRR